MTTTNTTRQADRKLRQALDLIKEHITAAESTQNRDLHQAVQLIVTAARKLGMLEPAGATDHYRETALEVTYACQACADEIEYGGISDKDGHFYLTGRTGSLYANCLFCGAGATAEIAQSLEVR